MSKFLDQLGIDMPNESKSEPSTLGTIIKAPIKGALKAVPQIGRGALEILAAPGRALASVTAPPQIEGFEQPASPTPGTSALSSLEDTIEEALPTQDNALGQILEGVGQLGTMAATGGLAGVAGRAGARLGGSLSRGAAAKSAATRGTFGAGASMSTDEFVQDQLSQDANASGGDIALNTAIGALTGLTEALPLFKALDRFKASRQSSRIRQTAQNTLQGTVEEGMQEAFQQTVQNMSASGIIKYDEGRGLFEGAGESAAIGGGVGGIVNFLATALGPGRRKGGLQESANLSGNTQAKAQLQQQLAAGELNPITEKEFVSAPAAKEFQYLQGVQEIMAKIPEGDKRQAILKKRFDERLGALKGEIDKKAKTEEGREDKFGQDPELQDVVDFFEKDLKQDIEQEIEETANLNTQIADVAEQQAAENVDVAVQRDAQVAIDQDTTILDEEGLIEEGEPTETQVVDLEAEDTANAVETQDSEAERSLIEEEEIPEESVTDEVVEQSDDFSQLSTEDRIDQIDKEAKEPITETKGETIPDVSQAEDIVEEPVEAPPIEEVIDAPDVVKKPESRPYEINTRDIAVAKAEGTLDPKDTTTEMMLPEQAYDLTPTEAHQRLNEMGVDLAPGTTPNLALSLEIRMKTGY